MPVAAFNAASIIDSYVLAPGSSLASSVTTFSAQNRGGGKYDRIPRGFGITMAIAVIYTVFVTLIILFAGRSSVWDIPETVGTKCHCAGTFLYPSHGLFLFYGRNDSHVPGILPGYRQVKVHFNRHLNPDPGPCHTDLWADLTA